MVFFDRELELYISTSNSTFTTDNSIKLSTLSGLSINYKEEYEFSYNYKIEDTPDRNREKVTTGYSDVKLLFSTYAKTILDVNHSCVEKLLLESLLGGTGVESTTNYTGTFYSVNKLPELYFWIKLSNNLVYYINNAVVKSCSYKIELNNAVTLDWEIIGLNLTQTNSASLPTLFTDYSSNVSFIKSNFSTATISFNTFPLNGGSIISGFLPIVSATIKLENNVEIVERSTLDQRLKQKLDHFVTYRNISIDLIGYLKTGVASNISTIELFDYKQTYPDLCTTTDVNFILTIGKENIIVFTLPKANIELPEIKINDVITSNINISSKTKNIVNDDFSIKYISS